MSEFPKQIKVQVAFDIGEVVYVITDEDQRKWIVNAYKVFENEINYEIYAPGRSYQAYEFELSRTKEL